MAPRKKFKSVDEYISFFPGDVQSVLNEMRKVIRETAPGAKEIISYNIPAFEQDGILVWYAAFKNHVGFYPKMSGIEVFKKELSDYKIAKGTVRFPLDKPIPFDLIKKIVKYRIKENSSK